MPSYGGVERRNHHRDHPRGQTLATHRGLGGSANLLFAPDSGPNKHMLLMDFHKLIFWIKVNAREKKNIQSAFLCISYLKRGMQNPQSIDRHT